MGGKLTKQKCWASDWESGPLREDGDHPLVGIIFQGQRLSPERMRYGLKSASREVRVDLKRIRQPCLRVEGNRRKRGQNIRDSKRTRRVRGLSISHLTSVQTEGGHGGGGRGSRA